MFTIVMCYISNSCAAYFAYNKQSQLDGRRKIYPRFSLYRFNALGSKRAYLINYIVSTLTLLIQDRS